MSDYKSVYDRVKAQAGNYEALLPVHYELDRERLQELRCACEMALVRELDDWYMGDPVPNISQAIHRLCRRLSRRHIKHVPRMLRSLGTVLAWTYAQLDHDADDAYLLMTHCLNTLGDRDQERIVPAAIVPTMERMLARWREDRLMPGDLSCLTMKEREVWDEITRWEVDPIKSSVAMEERVNAAKEAVAAAIPEAISQPIVDALNGALLAAQDVARGLVRSGALLEEVRGLRAVQELGIRIETLSDLRRVPIEALDDISQATMQGGKALAGGKGALLGLAGIVGMVVDLPALITLNLRFISQIAATYGFDVTQSEEERMFALSILGASSTSQGAKTAFLKQLNDIAVAVSKGKTWRYLNDKAIVQLIQQIAKALGVRLTKKTLGQIVPLIGSIVAGGSNYKFTHDNLVAARMMYRKRWLIQRCAASAG